MQPTTLFCDPIVVSDCEDGIDVLKDAVFMREFFVAATQKPPRIRRGKLTKEQRLARRREQRRLRRQAPSEQCKERIRRKKQTMKRQALEVTWLAAELAWRDELLARIHDGLSQRDLNYLVGALIDSDDAITWCRDNFWPSKQKDTLVSVPEWFELVSTTIQDRFYGDSADTDDEM